jgi:NAD+ kinase
MASHFKKVALFGKYHAPGARSVLMQIAAFLEHQDCEVFLEGETAQCCDISQFGAYTFQQIGETCDLGLVVGGDGTMLGVGRQMAGYELPLIGINQGRLGFITDIRFEDFEAVLQPMLAGQFLEDRRHLMRARVIRDGAPMFEARALNDVVVNRDATSGMVELRVEIDGHFVSKQRADGLIIASPTGATAYSLSAGGPLLHPSINGWAIVPIAPHTLSNRPIVLPDSAEVAVEIVSGRDVTANFDMQSLTSLMPGDRVLVTKSRQAVRFLHPVGWTYFDTLRMKLHWNEGGS